MTPAKISSMSEEATSAVLPAAKVHATPRTIIATDQRLGIDCLTGQCRRSDIGVIHARKRYRPTHESDRHREAFR